MRSTFTPTPYPPTLPPHTSNGGAQPPLPTPHTRKNGAAYGLRRRLPTYPQGGQGKSVQVAIPLEKEGNPGCFLRLVAAFLQNYKTRLMH